MAKPLPPLNALRAFDHLGVALFHRRARSIALTEAGQAHPGIDAPIPASSAPVDFANSDVDAAIRVSLGDHPGLHVERLMEERNAVARKQACRPGP